VPDGHTNDYGPLTRRASNHRPPGKESPPVGFRPASIGDEVSKKKNRVRPPKDPVQPQAIPLLQPRSLRAISPLATLVEKKSGPPHHQRLGERVMDPPHARFAKALAVAHNGGRWFRRWCRAPGVVAVRAILRPSFGRKALGFAATKLGDRLANPSSS